MASTSCSIYSGYLHAEVVKSGTQAMLLVTSGNEKLIMEGTKPHINIEVSMMHHCTQSY